MSGKESAASIKKAKVEFDSIVKFAQDNLLRESEEKINKMIEEAIDEVQKETIVTEAMKIETDEMKITVDDDGSVSVDHKEPEAAEEVPAATAAPVDAVTQAPVDAAPAAPPVTDAVADEEEIEITSDEDDIELAEEADETQANMNTPQPAAPAPVAPAPEAAPVDAAPVDAAPPVEGNPLAQELADVIQKMIDQSTGGSADDGTGVDIVDDEAAVGAAAPMAPAPAAPPVEEMVELEEELIELELEEDEEVMDEMKAMGQSHSINRTAGPHTAPKNAVDNRTRVAQKMNENTDKDKAQYEATIAELNKENKSLKGQIGEFKEAFIELREQFNEVQTFNKKLALAHRIIASGGLTEKEKVRISERFEAAKNAEEAERIYKEIISEKSIPQNTGSVIRSSAIPVEKPKAAALYESTEAKRARKLAGIDGPDPDSMIG